MKRKINNGYYALRFQVLQRDSFTCQYCGQYAPNVKLEVDHKIEIQDGGEDSLDNLITSCYACNRGRSGLRIQITRGNHVLGPKPFTSPLSKPASRQNEALNILKSFPSGLTARQLAEKLNISVVYASMLIWRLKKREKITKLNEKLKTKIWLSN